MLVPLFNPDIFWHLKAGDWVLAHRQLPSRDLLSYTRAGQPWLDFEWLAQVVFSLIYARAGLLGLWVLKIVLVAAAWLLLDRALAETGASGAARAAGLALFSTTAFSVSDARPDLFSLILSCALLWRLERWRLGRLRRPGLELAVWAALFALWADLHAGFFCGWALIGCYAAAEALAGRRRKAAEGLAALSVCVLATAANPYGLGPHRVFLWHLRLDSRLSTTIAEWHPISAENPFYWPFWPTLGLAALLAVLRGLGGQAKARLLSGCALAAVVFGAAALAHSRMAPFFAAPAALLIVLLAQERGWLEPRALAPALAGYAVFSLWLATRINWDIPFNYKFVPRAAAEFMDENRGALEPLRFYNPWETGGYLEWRLPWFRPFFDGRYIFHDDLLRVQEAAETDAAWIDFSAREGFTAELLPNLGQRTATTRVYPDGSTAAFQRPWYLGYMPRERWALVYWDRHSLLFVDRGAAPAAWLAAHEYRYVRPGDDAAFADARARHELPEDVIAAERARHACEGGL